MYVSEATHGRACFSSQLTSHKAGLLPAKSRRGAPQSHLPSTHHPRSPLHTQTCSLATVPRCGGTVLLGGLAGRSAAGCRGRAAGGQTQTQRAAAWGRAGNGAVWIFERFTRRSRLLRLMCEMPARACSSLVPPHALTCTSTGVANPFTVSRITSLLDCLGSTGSAAVWAEARRQWQR
jgi:hypothetical protein